ncbi:MAG: alpha/beta hydrolase [Clostridiales bacterium]|nr:alpha/beta hydrolase [Clostridiales bacterium]
METFKLWENTPGMCVEEPVITYYKPEKKTKEYSVVILPGGGYACRADHEGVGYAEFLNSYGITAFVVDYRVSPHRFPLPLLDARRAMRFVRKNAEKFDVDPGKTAIMGSSAGGHLAAMLSTYTDGIEFEGADDTDGFPFVPNAQILCYPVICPPSAGDISHFGSYENLLGKDNLSFAGNVSPCANVTNDTPKAFIWHTANDECVNVLNSIYYAEALKKHDVPFEMHIFPNGHHGLGVAASDPHVAQWTKLLVNWLS